MLTVREPTSINVVSAIDQNKPPSDFAFGYSMLVTYKVSDQFGDAVCAGIAVDETITVCQTSHPSLPPPKGGDTITTSDGTIVDRLYFGSSAPIPASFTRITNQTFKLAGGAVVLSNVHVQGATSQSVSFGETCTP